MADDAVGQPQTPNIEIRADLLRWCEAWQSCFQNVLTQVSGAPAGQAAVFEISAEQLPPAATDLWYTVTAEGAAQGEMTLRLPAASARRMALKFLGEPEAAAPADADPGAAAQAAVAEHKEALEELLRQISGLAATSLAPSLGGEVRFSVAESAAPAWLPDADVALRTRDEAGNEIAIEIKISPTLSAALRPKQQQAVSEPAPAPRAAPAPASAASLPAAAAPAASAPSPSAPAMPAASAAEMSNYHRLMEVGLDVKLRFGTRQMQLRDVLALSAGIVIELDNPLHSPVDLLLDGRLIAQGEVVVVDGKYGLRVTEVVDHERQPA